MIEAIEFVKAHWQKLGVGLAALFAFTTWQGCTRNLELNAKLIACETKAPQVVTVAAKAKQDVRIVYRDGSPCPDVTATNDSEAVATVAEAKPLPCPSVPTVGLWIGGGYLGTPYVSAGVQWKAVQVEAKRGPLEWGAEGKYRLVSF
jgi:hypothetical protein